MKKVKKKDLLASKVIEILATKGIKCDRNIDSILEAGESYTGLPVPTRGMPYSSRGGRLQKIYTHLTGSEFHKQQDTIKVDKLASTNQIRAFYNSYDWKQLRYIVLKKYKGCCMVCNNPDAVLHVDHIKPIRKYWSSRLDITNLQVLCEDCNHGKGNWDETDWRDKPSSNLADDFYDYLSQWYFWEDLAAALKRELISDLVKLAMSRAAAG